MKLSDVKEKIDDFFDRTTPQELYNLSLRYGFQEIEDKDEETMHNSEKPYLHLYCSRVHS